MKKWSHIWLNEGFASYAEALWQEHKFGKQAYLAYMRDFDIGYFPTSVFVKDSTNISALFSSTVYNKGAWVLHMLRKVIGDEYFFNTLKEYNTKFAFSNATTENFRNLCEINYGKNLEWFFDQWIYGENRPRYEFNWADTLIENNYVVRLLLSQVQLNTQIFKMPIDVQITTATAETTFVIWDSLASQSFEFTLKNKPLNLTVDPDGWVLKNIYYIPIIKPFSLSQNYPNPFNNSTKIQYRIPFIGEVRLEIYNILGQKINTLVKERQLLNEHTIYWNGHNSDGVEVSSGIYFYSLIFNDKNKSIKKMIKIK
jgi:hypothetical protein